jgi:hypothetical protein
MGIKLGLSHWEKNIANGVLEYGAEEDNVGLKGGS